jgi:hypothetical protein
MWVQPYQKLNLVSDPSVFDGGAHLRPEHLYDDEDLERANQQLSQIFSLYGGYMQLSLNTRDEVMESRFMKAFLKQMRLFREQIEEKDHEIETLRDMMETMTHEVVESKKLVEEKKAEVHMATEETHQERRQFQEAIQK